MEKIEKNFNNKVCRAEGTDKQTLDVLNIDGDIRCLLNKIGSISHNPYMYTLIRNIFLHRIEIIIILPPSRNIDGFPVPPVDRVSIFIVLPS